jgi:hypothetical protein
MPTGFQLIGRLPPVHQYGGAPAVSFLSFNFFCIEI